MFPDASSKTHLKLHQTRSNPRGTKLIRRCHIWLSRHLFQHKARKQPASLSSPTRGPTKPRKAEATAELMAGGRGPAQHLLAPFLSTNDPGREHLGHVVNLPCWPHRLDHSSSKPISSRVLPRSSQESKKHTFHRQNFRVSLYQAKQAIIHFFSPKEANEAKATHVIDGLQSQPVASQADHAGCHQGLPACYRLASAPYHRQTSSACSKPIGPMLTDATRARPACYRLASAHIIDRLQSQPVSSQARHDHLFSPKEANEAKATHVIDGLQSQPVASQADHAGCHQGLPACYRLASAHIIDRLRQPVASPSGHGLSGWPGRQLPGCFSSSTSDSACSKPSRKLYQSSAARKLKPRKTGERRETSCTSGSFSGSPVFFWLLLQDGHWSHGRHGRCHLLQTAAALQWSLVTICYVLNVFVSFLGFSMHFSCFLLFL